MTDDSPPEGADRFAELVHRQQIESERQRQRLHNAPIEQIKRVLQDRQESLTARAHPFGMLLERRDPELPGILEGVHHAVPHLDRWTVAPHFILGGLLRLAP